MRVIRLFFICLAVIAALALLIVGAGFSPVVQLWFFNRQLAQFPSLHASVESVWAGFSSVEFTALRVERDGIVLTAPSLTVQLPVKTALWDRRLLVGTLVAKGWTLDLTGRPATGAKETPTATGPTPAHDQPAAPPIATVLLGLLNRVELPCDLALDGVELEGDVLTHSSTGPNPASLHVVIKGGKLSPAHAGEFELEAGGRVPIARLSSNRVAILGRVNVGLKTPRTFDRVEFIGRVTSAGAALPPDLDVSAAVATDATPTFRLEFIRGTRRLASFTANVAKDSSAMAGTWRLDLRESDLAPFFLRSSLAGNRRNR